MVETVPYQTLIEEKLTEEKKNPNEADKKHVE
jgi:hypothetical protein